MRRISRSSKDKPAQKRFEIPLLCLSYDSLCCEKVEKCSGFSSASGAWASVRHCPIMKAFQKTRTAVRGQSSNERAIFTPCERFERVDFDFGLSPGMSKKRAILYSFEAER